MSRTSGDKKWTPWSTPIKPLIGRRCRAQWTDESWAVVRTLQCRAPLVRRLHRTSSDFACAVHSVSALNGYQCREMMKDSNLFFFSGSGVSVQNDRMSSPHEVHSSGQQNVSNATSKLDDHEGGPTLGICAFHCTSPRWTSQVIASNVPVLQRIRIILFALGCVSVGLVGYEYKSDPFEFSDKISPYASNQIIKYHCAQANI